MDIPLRHGALHLRAVRSLLVYVAVATAAFVAAALLLEGTALAVVGGLLLVVWLLVAAGFAWTWIRLRGIDSPLGLHGTGVVSRSPFGELVVPWDAVQSVAIERRTLRVRLVPAGDPRAAAIDASRLAPSAYARVQRDGIRISLAALDIPLDDLERAVVVQSGGRFQL